MHAENLSLCFPSLPIPTPWEPGITVSNGCEGWGRGEHAAKLGSDLRTLDSSDSKAPETINRNVWQEGEKGQAFPFFRMLSSTRERMLIPFKLGMNGEQLSGQVSELRNFAAVATVKLIGH